MKGDEGVDWFVPASNVQYAIKSLVDADNILKRLSAMLLNVRTPDQIRTYNIDELFDQVNNSSSLVGRGQRTYLINNTMIWI
jgi:hypothetical protein